jgi:MFS family permease
MNSATSGPDSAPPLSAGAGRYRWVICGLLFAATAVNYIDRQMIGVLKPTLQAEFGWNENAYSTIILWFQLAYALGYLSFGKIVDQIGARAGYAIAIVIWTIGHVAHGFAGASPPLPPRALGWAWAIGQFPRRYPRRGRLVPAKGAGTGHRHLQRGRECGGDHHPAAGPGSGAVVRMADGVLCHRHLWRGLAGGVVGALSPSLAAPA